jgi:hypothetical protein
LTKTNGGKIMKISSRTTARDLTPSDNRDTFITFNTNAKIATEKKMIN